jgi:type II secretory ATPase GspE/PulE/Tfp pilus assembly ATPase PilB-like protein
MAKELGLTNGAACFRGKGCPSCRQGGYKGRCGTYELLTMNDEVKSLVLAKTSANKIREAARATGMRTLRDDGLAKVKAGVTTVEEVLRVTALE